MELSSTALSAAGDAVEVVVRLSPGAASSAADVAVEVLGEDTLLVQCTATGGPHCCDCDAALRVALPAPVDPDTGRVRFKRSTGKLIFTAAVTSRSRNGAQEDSTGGGARALSAAGACAALGGLRLDAAVSPQQPTVTGADGAAAPTSAPAPPLSSQTAPATTVHPGPEAGPQPRVAAHPAAQFPDPVSPPGNGPASDVVAFEGATNNRDGWNIDGADGSGAEPRAGPGAAAAAARSTADPPSRPCWTADTTAAGGGGANCGGGLPSGAIAVGSRAPGTNSVASSPAAAGSCTATDGDDDAALYRDFYCDSPPAMPPPALPQPSAPAADTVPPAPPSQAPAGQGSGAAAAPSRSEHATPTSPGRSCSGSSDDDASGRGGASVNAARVAAAFEPTGGTSSRDAGFSFTAPDLPLPPPLPPGLPPIAPPIDCRYLAVANGLRVSGHASTAALAELMGLRRRPSAAAERRKADRAAEILQRVADTLDAYGYAVLDNYISEAAIQGARAELRVMEPHYSPGMIWVGKEAETGAQISVSSVRGDVVLWLDDQALNATAFVKDGVRRSCSFMQLQQMLADVDELVFEGLRPRLPYLAGLHRRSDAMMAIYPGRGSRFAKHVDNTTHDGRRLTVLTYLNPGWQEQQGGVLRLFPLRQGASEVVDVPPMSGRVALFLSAEVAHEVMPAFAPRHAVTLWYFDAGEHAAALTAAKVLPGASSRPSAQAAATALLRDLLADEAASGIQATPEGCAALATRVAALEAGAKQLLAAVLGLPSASALVESMRGLTPDSLRLRREELRNMGLGTQHHAPDTSAHI